MTRAFTVSVGSVATDIRIWWAYGSEIPIAACINEGGADGDLSSIKLDLYATARALQA